MIRSFGSSVTEDFFHGRRTSHSGKMASTIRTTALRKLDLINAATSIEDLRSPPGNLLEKLTGDFRGFHSIRINQQWQLIFMWNEGGAESVEIVGYHE